MSPTKPGQGIACLSLAALLAFSSAVSGQGVPVFDPAKLAQELKETARLDADLIVQKQRQTETRNKFAAERRQRDELAAVTGGMRLPAGGRDTSLMLNELEGDSRALPAATDTYRSENSSAADRLFGDGREGVEQIIIRAAKATHGRQKAGLSLIQWRCWIQALIWQESRFNPHARSPVGAYGLTQIMPGTAGDLGIKGTFRNDPFVQAEGGARYLAQQLNAFNGDMILALAAYNAGAGNVRKHSGVPPFAETQKYVQVIPTKYREYMTKIGAADQIGSIEPSYLANAEKAMIGGATVVYADEVHQDMGDALSRLDQIMGKIDKTTNAAEAMALNSYARAEFARLLVMRTRLNATRAKPVSAEQMAAAAGFAQQQKMMNFETKDM